MDFIDWALVALWAFGNSVQTLGTARFLARRSGKPGSEAKSISRSISRKYPGISILKPLKGLDPGLEGNIRSFFRLELAEFELLFCFETPDDPAFAVVRKVAAEFPGVTHRFFFSGGAQPDRNPKVANMEGAYRSASHDWILVSDSNVRMTTAQVEAFMQEALEPGVGIVSAVVRGDAGLPGVKSSFAGELEATILNTFYARGMVLAEMIGKECVVGKLMLFRRSVLDRLGGVRVLGSYLAEDYMAGVGLKHLGYSVRIAREPITQIIGAYRFRDFWNRHLRWGRIRKAQAPLAFLSEPVAQTAFLSVVAAGFGPRLGWHPAEAAFVQIGFLGVQDFVLQSALGARLRMRSLLAWFAREALAPIQWIATLLGSEVEWRGRRLSVAQGGILTRMKEAL